MVGRRVAILAEREFEDLELWYPLLRLREAGHTIDVLGTEKEKYVGKHGLSVTADGEVHNASPEIYDLVVVPGGWAPDRLRRYQEVLEFVKEIFQRGGLVASICHGPHVLVSAEILKGRTITCVSAIKDDVINAGAEYVDQEVVVDGNLITSRYPEDLPAFCVEIIKALKK
jgi:protease I